MNKCPSCGYCSHCGRGGNASNYPFPTVQPMIPYHYTTGVTNTDLSQQKISPDSQQKLSADLKNIAL